MTPKELAMRIALGLGPATAPAAPTPPPSKPAKPARAKAPPRGRQARAKQADEPAWENPPPPARKPGPYDDLHPDCGVVIGNKCSGAQLRERLRRSGFLDH